MKLELPKSMIGGEHDTPAQHAYVAALGSLPHADAMPPAVLGALLHTVREDAHPVVLDLMALVTPGFWRAARRALEDLDWPVKRPEHVHRDSSEFDVQTRIAYSLATRMRLMPMATPALNEGDRQKHATDIVRLATELKQALDEGTGYGPDGRYRGLWLVQPYSVIQQIVGMSCGYSFDWPRDEGFERAVHRVTLQDVLAWTAGHIESKANDPAEEGSREVPKLHTVVSRALADWFAMIADEAGDDAFTVPRIACRDTAAALLRAHYPNEPILERPFG